MVLDLGVGLRISLDISKHGHPPANGDYLSPDSCCLLSDMSASMRIRLLHIILIPSNNGSTFPMDFRTALHGTNDFLLIAAVLLP